MKTICFLKILCVLFILDLTSDANVLPSVIIASEGNIQLKSIASTACSRCVYLHSSIQRCSVVISDSVNGVIQSC